MRRRVGGVDRTATAFAGFLIVAAFVLSAGSASGLTAATTYRDEVLADGPVSYWRLGESAGTTALDERTANPGTYAGGTLLGQPGALPADPNTSASFDGVNDYMSVPDSNSLDMTGAVTLEFWAKRRSVTSRFEVVVAKPGNGQSRMENYAVWLSSSNIYQAYFGNGTSYVLVATPAVTDTGWHHVVAEHDGASARIYLDGVLREQKATTIGLTANAFPLNVGRTNSGANFFTGWIDEVAVYPTALSQARVTAHFDKAREDAIAPVVSLVSPANGSLLATGSTTFSGIAGMLTGDSDTVTVRVYSGTQAAGTPFGTLTGTRAANASWSAATTLGDGVWTAQAEQRDAAGNSGLSSANTFTVDTTAPTVAFSSGPASPTNSQSASLVFASNEPGAQLSCSLDGTAFQPCTSPQQPSGLTDGQHRLEARATDQAGNTGAATAWVWTIDTAAPPAPRLDGSPPNPSGSGSATFAFSDSEAGVGFRCSLDNAAFQVCTSPQVYGGLLDGAHTFQVVASDQAGNVSPPTSYLWTVDTIAPTVTITSGPTNPSSSTSASFAFSTNDASAQLACSLDSASFQPCSSPYGVSGLTEGQHRFEVRATDQVGNVGSAARTWTVAAAALAPPTITAGPPSFTSSRDATFSFSHPQTGISFECRLDGGAFAACTSPQTYGGLPDGSHVFQVQARSSTGNQSAPASRIWTIDTISPGAPRIDAAPPALGNSTTASFSFSASETPSGVGPLGSSLPPRLPASTGATYYVSTTGSDSNSGTLASPWATIQKAMDTLKPGERALVRGGVYVDNLSMIRGGTPSAPLTVENYPGEAPVLRADSTEANNIPLSFRNGTAYVRFSGFVIEGASGVSTTDVYVRGTAHHVEISHCEIANSQEHGIFTDRSTHDVQILNNTIHDNGSAADVKQDHGVYVEGTNQLVAGNVIYDQPRGWGIQVYPSTNNVIVTQNTVVGNDLGGIVVGGDGHTYASFTTVVANVVAFNTRYGIRGYYPGGTASPGTGNVAHDNLAFGNPSGNLVNDSATLPEIDFSGGNLTADPLFVDTTGRDLRLSGGSPALDKAPAAYSEPDDRDGNVRPYGAAADLGAYELGVLFSCRLDGGAAAPCSSPKRYEGLADGAHAFQVTATDGAGNTGPPASYSWTVDTTPPTTTIAAGPNGSTNATSATFQLASEPGATFECSLDGAPFTPCTSPHTVTGLADGPHELAARAVDGAGNVGNAVTRSWTVDTAPPSPPTIVSAPADPSRSAGATFSFSATESDVGFECSLDAAVFATCTSPQSYTGLADGRHTFSVRSRDAAGNVSAPAAAAWTIDTQAPTVTISAGPNDPTNATSANFAFAANETGATLECGLDGGAFSPCTSPAAYSGLAEGQHTFAARATDPAGNTGAAAMRTWKIDTTPPTARITAGPLSPSGSSATIAFDANEPPATFQCSLDGAAFTSCTSPRALSGLADGSHTFSVRATDAAGNTGAAAVHTWAVDSQPPPAPSIDAGPSGTTAATTATFSFSVAETGAVPECKLDGASFAVCSSPVSYSGLGDGSHTFSVRARDAAGNLSAVTSRTWTVATAPPPAPSVRSASSASVNGAGTIGIARPAGTSAGDLLLAVVAHQGGSARNMTPPAGWTAVPNGDYYQGTNARIHAWYRFAGSAEPAAYTFTLVGDTGQDIAGGMLAITAANTTAPINASLGQVNAITSIYVTAPSITTTAANTLLVFAGAHNVTATYTPPTGMTERFDLSTTGAFRVSTEVATQVLGAAGATGTRQATVSSSGKSVALAIAVAPR